jgi:PEP-CTERM motif
MTGICPICLTKSAASGYLFLLFPLPMERGLSGTGERAPDVTESPAQRETQRGILKRLRGIRGRFGAALIAVAGSGALPEKSDGATMMIDGEIVEGLVFEQADYAASLWNYDSLRYDIGHADGIADTTLTWYSVRSPEYFLEQYLDTGSDVPYTMVQPDQLNDGNRSPFLLVVGDIPETQSLRLMLDVRKPNGFGTAVSAFLKNAEVHAGFGPLTGVPQTVEEAIAMTDGPVMHGTYPGTVNQLDEALLFRNLAPVAVPGDYNGDHIVDASDFDTWRAQFGSSSSEGGASLPPPPNADGNGDGVVDAADYVVWRKYAASSGGSGAATLETGGTPEPSTMVLAGAGLAGIGLAARRRFRQVINRHG